MEFTVLSLVFFSVIFSPLGANAQTTIPPCDQELLQFALNLEYLEAEFFLYGAFGHGLDQVAPELAAGGQHPIGARRANLGIFTQDIVAQFGYQEVEHLRLIRRVVDAIPRPVMDLSSNIFAEIMNMALGMSLNPPFDPYFNDLHFLIACYMIPYIGRSAYVGSSSYMNSTTGKRLVAGLLAVESAQDAVIRAYLYQRALQPLYPYWFTVATATDRISTLRNRLGGSHATSDTGVFVLPLVPAGEPTSGNVINAGYDGIASASTPREILRIVYVSGNEGIPGGFFPSGANGTIARSYLPGSMTPTTCSLPNTTFTIDSNGRDNSKVGMAH